MNEKDRMKIVKEGLENDVYKKIEELETTQHLSKESTAKLASNLRSYIEGKDLEDEINLNKELKEVAQHKVQVGSVDEKTLVEEYNNHIYNTLDDNLFAEEDEELEEYLDRTLTEMQMMEEEKNIDFEAELGFADSEENIAQDLNIKLEATEPSDFEAELGFDSNEEPEIIETKEVDNNDEKIKGEVIDETIEIDESDVDIETNVLEQENPEVEKRKEKIQEKREKKLEEIENLENEEEDKKMSIIDILLIVAMIVIILLIVYIFFL